MRIVSDGKVPAELGSNRLFELPRGPVPVKHWRHGMRLLPGRDFQRRHGDGGVDGVRQLPDG
jgi:hypothetical protein